jgi:small nuclear ribonucleoprotein (snRNP)-like protein
MIRDCSAVSFSSLTRSHACLAFCRWKRWCSNQAFVRGRRYENYRRGKFLGVFCGLSITDKFPSLHCGLLSNMFASFLVSCKMKSGEIYRGLLVGAEETMNMSLSEVLRTARNGQISKLPSVYLRGSSIRFIALPDLLKNAPVFQKVVSQKRKIQSQQSRQKGKFAAHDV